MTSALPGTRKASIPDEQRVTHQMLDGLVAGQELPLSPEGGLQQSDKLVDDNPVEYGHRLWERKDPRRIHRTGHTPVIPGNDSDC